MEISLWEWETVVFLKAIPKSVEMSEIFWGSECWGRTWGTLTFKGWRVTKAMKEIEKQSGGEKQISSFESQGR